MVPAKDLVVLRGNDRFIERVLHGMPGDNAHLGLVPLLFTVIGTAR